MSPAETLAAFTPAKPFFVGIDSDGTAFDSMSIKHIDAFLPAVFSVWDFGSDAARERFVTLWEHINLYSKHRGINRFPGLCMAFEEYAAGGGHIASRAQAGASAAVDSAPLKAFIEGSAVLSNAALEAWLQAHPSPFLDDVYRWSREADRLFAKYTEGLMPFKGVAPALQALAASADIMVISSASGKGLVKDWSFSGLDQYLALTAGQEAGNKTTQLRLAASGKYPSEKILMIGDAPGDLDAARGVDASFFPIMPGAEEASWERLRAEALPRFFAGTFRGAYEDSLLAAFNAALR
ncbi:MAG: HAD family hydrolase [Treponema sp.]|jgi:phosphoglycolate phosphatase-like HAD superfamily hydrolase|nr:HAD family hydrolase [Treponema sp.]